MILEVTKYGNPILRQKGARIPIDRPALPEPELPRREDGVDLVAVAVTHEFPHQVVRGREFRPVEIDEQEIGGETLGDRAGHAREAGGVRCTRRRPVEPEPAAAAGRIARGKAEAGTLQALVDPDTWAARGQALLDPAQAEVNGHGLGRELFGGMRRSVRSAEEGAVTWL